MCIEWIYDLKRPFTYKMVKIKYFDWSYLSHPNLVIEEHYCFILPPISNSTFSSNIIKQLFVFIYFKISVYIFIFNELFNLFSLNALTIINLLKLLSFYFHNISLIVCKCHEVLKPIHFCQNFKGSIIKSLLFKNSSLHS